MTSLLASWLFVISAFLHLLFYIAAMIYVIFRRGDESSAKTFAVFGIGILLFLQILGFVINVVLAQYPASSEYVFYRGVIGIVTTVVHLLAMSLLIAAVFVGRSSDTQPPLRDKITPSSSDNPYAPPVG